MNGPGQKSVKLSDLGWTDEFAQYDVNTESLVKIIAVHLNYFKAISVKGELNCYFSGKQHQAGEFKVTVGDWCVVHKEFTDEKNCAAAIIESLIPRKSKISRMKVGGVEQIMASNVDYCFIVTSANEDLNINRLDRYLQLARAGKVQPVIVLSKVDINENYNMIKEDLKTKFPGTDILAISVKQNIGLEGIHKYVNTAGQTGVCLGSSGVGKSTLVNYILGANVQATKKVSEHQAKGKHTTTSRELFFITGGGMIIDTPGIREVQLLTGDIEIKDQFNQLSELELQCKFSNCAHETEPGCAIKKALANEEFTSDELKSYFKLKKELERNEKKLDRQYQSNLSKKNKSISKHIKAVKKGKK